MTPPNLEQRDEHGVCVTCGGERWVCENHPDRAWPDVCDCGAGMPCAVCNPCDNGPPLMPPGSVTIWSADLERDGTFEGQPVEGGIQ